MIKVIDTNGDTQEVEVIRYFSLNEGAYLLYSLNEVDDQEYVKLYGTKVNQMQGGEIGDDEWETVKEEIKKIIKGNKAGDLAVNDLNFQEIDGLTVQVSRVFKLTKQLVDLLKANKKEFEPKAEEPVANEVPEPAVEESAEVEVPEPAVEESAEVEVPEPAVEESAESEVPVPSGNEFDLGIEQPAEEATPTPEFEEVRPSAAADLPSSEEVNQLEPQTVGEAEPTDAPDYEKLYQEAVEAQEALKNENEALQNKIAEITKILNQ